MLASVPSPSPPAARLSAIASTADPADSLSYDLTAKDVALAGALFTSGAPDFASLALAAGLTPADLSRVCASPARAAAIIAHADKAATFGRAAVYARLLNMALTSRSATWAKLYLERFDDVYKNHKLAESATYNQNNYVSSMTDTELQAFLKLTTKATLGEARA